MTPFGGLLQRQTLGPSAAQSACLPHVFGSHPTSKSRGLCRTYAAAVVSEIEQRSSANGSSPPLDVLNAAVASRRSLPTSPEALDLPPHGFDSIESALEALRQGGMVVVLDDEDRENEGDLIMAADKVSANLSPSVSRPYRKAPGILRMWARLQAKGLLKACRCFARFMCSSRLCNLKYCLVIQNS